METKRTSVSHDQRGLEPTITPEQSELLKGIYEVCCGKGEGITSETVSWRSLISYASKLELKDFEDLAKKIVEFSLLYDGLRWVMELGDFDQISDLNEGQGGFSGGRLMHDSQHIAQLYSSLRSNKNFALNDPKYHDIHDIGESLAKLAAIMRMHYNDFIGAASYYRNLEMVKEENEMEALNDKRNTEEVRQLRKYHLYDSAENKVKEINISIQAGLDVEGKFKRELEECKKKFKDVHIPTSEEVLTLIEEIKNRIEGVLEKK